MEQITVGVLTISDRCFKKEAQDKSGPNLVSLIREGAIRNAVVSKTALVPDDIDAIQTVLAEWCDHFHLKVILTTGGTGLSARDVTPEATLPLLERLVPGISLLIFKYSSDITPLAALSRGVCGVRKKSLIINFPGSLKAAEECLRAVAGVIPHAEHLISGEDKEVAKVHSELQSTAGSSRVNAKHIVERPRQSQYPLFSVEEAQKCVLRFLEDPKVLTINGLNASHGYLLAEDICSEIALPPFPASIKDGYAVISSDFSSLVKKVIGDSSAGDSTDRCHVVNGSCARINTGAPVPPGADAVIQVEDTVLEKSEGKETELEVRFLKWAEKGQDIRPIGSDIKVGEIVLRKGTFLGACELGVLATVGVTSLKVFAKPSVGVLSTGNELQNPDEKIEEGKIRDSNRTTLIHLLKEEGFDATDLGIARDDPDALFNSIKRAFEQVDVLITTGSVSMGEKDYLKQVLAVDFNAKIHFGRVQMKPGKPTSFATVEEKDRRCFWFGLPGNPVSAAVTCQLFVLPALRALAGWKNIYPKRLKCKLEEHIKLDERPEYRRAILTFGNGNNLPEASTTGNQISSRLLSCVGANCLLELPPSSSSCKLLERGSAVDALLIQKLN